MALLIDEDVKCGFFPRSCVMAESELVFKYFTTFIRWSPESPLELCDAPNIQATKVDKNGAGYQWSGRTLSWPNRK